MKKSGKEHSIAVKILPLAVILLLAVGALLYGANRWVIQIDILGDQTQYVEYGAKFEDPGAAAVRKGSAASASFRVAYCFETVWRRLCGSVPGGASGGSGSRIQPTVFTAAHFPEGSL
jgi:hypothetical protein